MGVKERRERQRETLRRDILDAARDLFVSEGYDNVSMRKIAERIEYSPTTIYLYFKDKTQIFHALCEETFGELVAALDAINGSEGDSLTRLRRGMRAYVDFGLANPHHYFLTFMTPRTSEAVPEGCDIYETLGSKAFDRLRQGVRECIEAGMLAPANVEIASQALWASVHGITALLISKPNFPWVDHDTVIDQVIVASTEGLGA